MNDNTTQTCKCSALEKTLGRIDEEIDSLTDRLISADETHVIRYLQGRLRSLIAVKWFIENADNPAASISWGHEYE